MANQRTFQLGTQTTALASDVLAVDNVSYGAAMQVPVPTLIGKWYGPASKFTPVNDALFSWVNQGGASIDTTSYAPALMSCPAAAAHSYHIRKKPIIGASFTLTTFISASNVPSNYWTSGIGVRNGSGDANDGKFTALHMGFSGGQYIAVDRYNSVASFNINRYGTGNTQLWSGVWLRIISDGTTLTFQISNDGFVFGTLYTEPISSFVGQVTDVFWGGDHFNSVAGSAALWSWTEV